MFIQLVKDTLEKESPEESEKGVSDQNICRHMIKDKIISYHKVTEVTNQMPGPKHPSTPWAFGQPQCAWLQDRTPGEEASEKQTFFTNEWVIKYSPGPSATDVPENVGFHRSSTHWLPALWNTLWNSTSLYAGEIGLEISCQDMKLFPSADVCSFWIGRSAEAWNGPALGSGDRYISLRQKKHLFQTLFDLSWLFRTAWSRWTGHRSRLPRGWQCWGLRRLVWSATGTSWSRLG